MNHEHRLEQDPKKGNWFCAGLSRPLGLFAASTKVFAQFIKETNLAEKGMRVGFVLTIWQEADGLNSHDCIQASKDGRAS
jgi:hypothetical protein